MRRKNFINEKHRKGIGYLLILCSCLTLLFSILFIPEGQGEEDAPIKVLFFYSKECEHCEQVNDFILTPLQKVYPLQIEKICIDEVKGYEQLLKKEEESGDKGNEIPVIGIGRKLLGGETEIESQFESLVRELLEQQKGEGAPLRIKKVEEGEQSLPGDSAPSDQMIPDNPQKLPVYAAYFYKHGCKECDRANKDLHYLQLRYPHLTIKTFDIFDPNSKTLNEALGIVCKVPEKKRLTTPSLFIGEDYLLGNEIRVEEIERLIRKYTDNPMASPWERAKAVQKEAEKTIISRFAAFSFSTIVLAGLLDGINPCAFATIIFFISYLIYIGRKDKEILLVGGAFTFAVFMTYLLIGLGFLTFIKGLSFLPLLSRIVYIATALFALVLGVLSLRDYFICRSGNISDMTLQLPAFLKKRIHKTIRKEANVQRYVLGALTTGFMIAFLELACTGQVYLPTIIFVTRISALQLRSFFYLFIYNIMFISPLFVIFITVYKGTTSKQLTSFFQKSTATIKLCTALFFFILATVLIITII